MYVYATQSIVVWLSHLYRSGKLYSVMLAYCVSISSESSICKVNAIRAWFQGRCSYTSSWHLFIFERFGPRVKYFITHSLGMCALSKILNRIINTSICHNMDFVLAHVPLTWRMTLYCVQWCTLYTKNVLLDDGIYARAYHLGFSYHIVIWYIIPVLHNRI